MVLFCHLTSFYFFFFISAYSAVYRWMPTSFKIKKLLFFCSSLAQAVKTDAYAYEEGIGKCEHKKTALLVTLRCDNLTVKISR